MRKVSPVIALVFLFLLAGNIFFAQYEEAKDHPILSRYPGSTMTHYSQKLFDEYYLLVGPVKSTSEEDIQNAKHIRLEGTVTLITYEAPPERSNFEVYKNYELALEKAGFVILYKGRGNEIRGISVFLGKMNRHLTGWSDPDLIPTFYLAAKSPDERYFISLYVHGAPKPTIMLAVVEPKEMETGLVTVKVLETAETMKKEISEKGKVSIYGIYFDFDSDKLRPESKPVLDEIARLLKENPQLKLYVVGHTDSIGSLEYNMDLSLRRALTVVRELVEKYGIEESRLKAFGVGPLAPVDSNKTEEGRAKNRRVELVEQ